MEAGRNGPRSPHGKVGRLRHFALESLGADPVFSEPWWLVLHSQSAALYTQ
jgi:hypothetical protein